MRITLLLPLVLLAACARHATHGHTPAPSGPAASAMLESRSGSQTTGSARFEPVEGGVRVSIDLRGATPGLHGVHVHQVGDCSDPEAKSAGPHFAPEGHRHGLPPTAARHLGDLGNIRVGEDGTGTHELTVPGATVAEGDASSFLGRALVVHAHEDDGTDPAGNSGPRIACGVIR
jgi:superoxide dismutase, Cu-Zn family